MLLARTKEVFCSSLLACGLIATAACSSIVHNGPRQFAINSTPEGAKVSAYRQGSSIATDSGVTPKTFSLSARKGYFSGQPYIIKVEKEGFKPVEVKLKPEISGWYWGNLFFGGLIGMLIVDPATGAMWNLAVDTGDKKLDRAQRKKAAKDPVLVVKLVGETTQAERDKMVPIQ
ncbi:MAG TPA: hypothetical protein PKE57_02695 [Cellvibrionaceae bacterium]|nr:hypothetical protein [Cellvibrionaceae bacterium]HMW46976.1 hypothetical protein [Cellvibrionaceae bacterium]HMY38398.1 hypothetical protein [Marinagarivorans sp.]